MYTLFLLKMTDNIVSLLALQPNSGLGRLHETFRFTSATRSRTRGRTPWTGDQLVARSLPVHKHRKTHTQHKNLTSMPRVGLEPTFPAPARAKTVHALERSATVTDAMTCQNIDLSS
jgi:hypothetical protein